MPLKLDQYVYHPEDQLGGAKPGEEAIPGDAAFDILPGAPIRRNTVPAPSKYQPAGTFRAADSAGRKQFPLFSGLLAYFPDALADVARISYIGNDKHNPGEPLHWSRPKSNDHLDCAARHLTQAQWEDDEEDHLGEAIWRLLAEKQMRIEAKRKLLPPKNAVD